MNKKTLNYIILTLMLVIVMFLIVKAGCSETFRNIVYADKATVMLYYWDECPACKVAKPIYEKVMNDLKDKNIVFEMQDVTKEPSPGIDKVPTIMMTTRNYRRKQYYGIMNENEIKKWILLNY